MTKAQQPADNQELQDALAAKAKAEAAAEAFGDRVSELEAEMARMAAQHTGVVKGGDIQRKRLMDKVEALQQQLDQQTAAAKDAQSRVELLEQQATTTQASDPVGSELENLRTQVR